MSWEWPDWNPEILCPLCEAPSIEDWKPVWLGGGPWFECTECLCVWRPIPSRPHYFGVLVYEDFGDAA